MSPEPQRVVDVGGGYGRQAIMLAQLGHSVVIIDFDARMIAIARDQLSHDPQEVSSRVELVFGDGEAAASLVGTDFDLACCHSVLMYQDDSAPMLSGLVDLVRGGGLISVLCVNKEASAMRSGLQGRWRETAMSLEVGRDMNSRHVPSREHTREEVTAILESAGARVKAWHGVGVFTDHLTEKLVVDDPKRSIWWSGSRATETLTGKSLGVFISSPSAPDGPAAVVFVRINNSSASHLG